MIHDSEAEEYRGHNKNEKVGNCIIMIMQFPICLFQLLIKIIRFKIKFELFRRHHYYHVI